MGVLGVFVAQDGADIMNTFLSWGPLTDYSGHVCHKQVLGISGEMESIRRKSYYI